MKKPLTLSAIMLIGLSAFAQNSEHFKWLTGTWEGPGFGGTFEETWSKPDANGQLMAMFRYTNTAGEVVFYEFWVLNEEGMKLRHFNPDFTAWEDKTDYVNFKMIETTEDKITLKSLIYERVSDNEMKISLTLKSDGGIKTEVFNLKKIKD